MHRITVSIPMALLVVGLAGCGAPKPIKYYSLATPAAPSSIRPTYPVDVVVGRITGPSLLEVAPIVYRTGTNQIGTYQYHRWQDPPVELVRNKLVSLLRGSGAYQSVTSSTVSDTEFVIRGRLHDFAEVDGDTITGLVTIELELYNRRTAKILWSHFYTQTEPVEGKEVSAVAQAIDRNLDRGLREFMAGLVQYFAANPPKRDAIPVAERRQ
jgi:ABC-type uncharacterized transport system auxiliary subunit